MLNRELKRVIARVSMATLIVIMIFAALTVLLTARYDVGVRMAVACTPSPSPTPTPYYSKYPLPTTREVTFGGVVPSGRVFVAFNQAYTTWGAYGFGKSTISDTDALIAWNPSTNSMTTNSLTADDSWTSGTGVFDPRTPPTSPQSTSVSAKWADGNEVPSCGAGSSNDGTLGPTSPAIQVDLYHVSDINGTNTLVRASQGTWSVAVDGTTSVTYEWSSDQTTEKNYTNSWGGQLATDTNLTCKIVIGGSIEITKTKAVTVTARAGWELTPTCAPSKKSDDVIFVFPYYPLSGTSQILGVYRSATYTNGYCLNPTSYGAQVDDGYDRDDVASGPNKNLWYITSAHFIINKEALVNQYLYEGTTPPYPVTPNWHEYNESVTPPVNADQITSAAEAHEYMGMSPYYQGHHALLMFAAGVNDANLALEDNISNSESSLKSMSTNELLSIEILIKEASDDWPPFTHNYGGGKIYDWDYSLDQYRMDYLTSF